MTPFEKIDILIIEVGMTPPSQGERWSEASVKIYDALVCLHRAVDELVKGADPALLLTSENTYLRKLGKQQHERRNNESN